MAAPKNNKFAVGNKGGRPTKLTPEILELARSYLDSCKDWVDDNKRLHVSLPTIEGLARRLNVSTDTVYNWSKANKEFFGICGDVKAEQAKRLQENGLAGTYNPTITRLILSSKHGFVEKTETEHSGELKIKGVQITFNE